MARKQDQDNGNAVNLGGTVPGGHALGSIRQRLLDDPRERRWVIGQVVSATTTTKHPADGEDQPAPTMQFVDIAGITSQADCDQLAEMLKRAHRSQPGQATLDDAEAAAS
jgi:hypothetical protein